MARFCDRFKQLRSEKGISQADLAKQLKTSKSSVNMYERGEREPGFEMLEAIADYFNVDMDYLLGYSDQPHIILSVLDPDSKLTPAQQNILALYDAAPPELQKAALAVLKSQ